MFIPPCINLDDIVEQEPFSGKPEAGRGLSGILTLSRDDEMSALELAPDFAAEAKRPAGWKFKSRG